MGIRRRLGRTVDAAPENVLFLAVRSSLLQIPERLDRERLRALVNID